MVCTGQRCISNSHCRATCGAFRERTRRALRPALAPRWTAKGATVPAANAQGRVNKTRNTERTGMADRAQVPCFPRPPVLSFPRNEGQVCRAWWHGLYNAVPKLQRSRSAPAAAAAASPAPFRSPRCRQFSGARHPGAVSARRRRMATALTPFPAPSSLATVRGAPRCRSP